VPQLPTPAAPHDVKPANDSMTLLVAAVIVHDQDNDRVVLLRRGPNAKFARGLWDLPTGKSEPGEPITETAVRELREETGLVVDPGALRLAHLIHGAWSVESPNGFLTVVFAAHEWTGELANPEPDKHSEVRWTGTDAIPGDFVSGTARALAHYLSDDVRVTLRGWDATARLRT